MKKTAMMMVLASMVIGAAATTASAEANADGKTVITIWRGQGTDGEEALYNEEIEKFNEQSATTYVEYEVFPYDDFGTTVKSALATDTLPDMVYVDGTEVGNLVFLEGIVPITQYLDEEFTSQYASSAIYQVNGEVYGIAQQDGGLAFWANKKLLENAGVRIATYEEPWTEDEFLAACQALADAGEVKYPIDMKINSGSGYVCYAWQPLIVAQGADWYDHETMRAAGALDSEAMVSAMTFMKSLFDNGYADATQADNYFITGDAALELSGHWNYTDYKAALGDDLALIPLPDLGNGSYTAIGGLPWCATVAAEQNGTVENCVEFMKFAVGEQFQSKINDANGSMPVLKSAYAQIDSLKEGGDLYLYAQQLEGGKYAVRPMSAAFPTYQNEVGTAVFDILMGADIQETLSKAAANIDKVIEENGY